MLDIILFVIICFGLGFIVDLFSKNWDPDFLEGILIRFGVGLAIWPILGCVFGLVHIPLHWACFLGAGLIVVLLTLILKKFRKMWGFIEWWALILLGLTGISMFMFITGSFKYPWIEDSDGWEFAESSKYIGETGTYVAPFNYNHFAYPYPQGYQIVMGIMYQMNGSIMDTLKLFTNLIIAFGAVFAYYFFSRIMAKRTAFIAAVCLWAVPAFFSHFIYSMTFAITIMFIFLYASMRNWKIIASLTLASLYVTHFYSAVIATVFFAIIAISKILVTKEFPKSELVIGFFGLATSLIFWIPSYFASISQGLMANQGNVGGIGIFIPYWPIAAAAIIIGFIAYFTQSSWWPHIQRILEYRAWIYNIALVIGIVILILPIKIKYVKGSGDAIYGFKDFFIAQSQGLFNNPVGIGLIVMSLFTIGLIVFFINWKNKFAGENLCYFTAFNLALFSLIGVLGKSLSIGFQPFRMWVFWAIPCAMIAGITLSLVLDEIDKQNRLISIGVLIVVLAGVIFTSFLPKYQLNTSIWPEHKLYAPDVITFYTQTGLPAKARVTSLCEPTYVASSYGFNVKPWVSKEFADYYKTAMTDSAIQNYEMYTKNNISYVIVDVGCITKLGYNQTQLNNKLTQMILSFKFNIVKGGNGALLLEVGNYGNTTNSSKSKV